MRRACSSASSPSRATQCQPIALGTNTDPYQPVERRLRITRGVLEVLARCRHPLTIVTKSAAVVRDLDLLAPMARDDLARVAISVTTLDGDLARRLEPRAAAPHRRLQAIRQLSDAGVPTAVMVAPIIPALTDHEIERILEAAAAAGATSAGYVLLRLPHEVKELFAGWLAAHAPGRAEHVLSLVRQCRGGKLYDATFGRRMRGEGPYAQLIERRVATAKRRLGLAGTQRARCAPICSCRPTRMNGSCGCCERSGRPGPQAAQGFHDPCERKLGLF